MSKEKSMTFRVEPQLRELFNDAAAAEHRPAAQVLREFMRSYVDRVQRKTVSASNIDAEQHDRPRAGYHGGAEGAASSPR